MEKPNTTPEEPAVHLTVPAATEKLLAIVDPSTHALLAEFFQENTEELLVAENPQEGLKIFQKENPSVLLLDFHLPEMDGVAFLQEILAQNFPPQAMILLMDNPDEHALAACDNMGIHSFLMKPFRPEQLLGQVKQGFDWVHGSVEKQRLENRLVTVLKYIPALIWECDDQLCFSYVSDNVAQILGYSPQELLGQPFSKYLSEGDVAQFYFKFTENVGKLTEENREIPLHFSHQNGGEQLMGISAQNMFDQEGQPVGLLGISRVAVEGLEKELTKMLPDAAVRINEALELIEADASAQAILGLDPQSLPCNFIPYLVDASLESMVQFAFMQKEAVPFPLEVKAQAPAGKTEQFKVHFQYHEEGPFLEGQLIPADSTKQVEMVTKQAEINLEEQENVVVIDEDMQKSIIVDIQNLAQEILELLKNLESFEVPDRATFHLEEVGLFLQNKNIAKYRENVRLLSNKIHGLKGNSGFLIPVAKQLCHEIENITSPLSEYQLVFTSDLSRLLKKFIFKIQDMVEKYQTNPETTFYSAKWLERIHSAQKKAELYVGAAQSDFAKMIIKRSADHGKIRSRRQDYLSVSQEGYVHLSEQMKSFFYLVSQKFANEDLIEAGTLYNEFMSTHQTIKKVPLKLSRYERLVPNIAQQYGKEAEFIYKDHSVLADQEFWNGLHEILNHCLKNAITHGIELPEERRQAGKDPSGKVSVEVQEDSLSLYVGIVDDGKGIEVEKIAQKVMEQGVYTSEQLAQMSQSEILKLVFVQGVSTAQEVDDNAGRGVGMNAVQEVVGQFRGECQIESTLGQGTSWCFTFPKINVSLACFIIAIGDYSIAIPDTYVATFQDHKAEKISQAHGHKVFNYDDNYFPLVDTEKIFQENVQLDPNEKKSVLLLRNQHHFQGLLINRVLHHAMMPILNLPDMLEGNTLYLGVTLYGQEPVLVLNVEKLFSIAPSAVFESHQDEALAEEVNLL